MQIDRPNAPPNYLLLLIQEWKIVCLGALVCGAVGLAFHLVTPRTYESSAMVLVSPPLFKNDGLRSATPQVTRTPEEMSLAAAHLAELMPRTLPVETYRTIAVSKSIRKAVLAKVPIENTEIEDIEKKSQVILTSLGSRTPSFGTQYSRTLVFRVRWSSPEIATNLAQVWAELFKERADQLNQSGLKDTVALVDTMWKNTKQELETAENALREFQIKWDLDLLKVLRDSKELNLAELEATLVQVEIYIASQKAMLENVRTELAKEDKKDQLFRSPSSDVVHLNQLGLVGPDAKDLDSKTGLLTEEINYNYTFIRENEITISTLLSGLEQQRVSTIERLDMLRADIELLDDQIVVNETEEIRLLRDVETMTRTFSLAAASYEKSKIAQANTSSDIQIISNAVIPGRPVSTPAISKVFMAALAGALVSMAYIVLKTLLAETPLESLSRESKG